MSSTLKISQHLSDLQSIMLEAHDLETFSNRILSYTKSLIGAASSQIFLYEAESKQLKRIASIGEEIEIQPMSTPAFGEALIENDQFLLPLCNEQNVTGYIICREFSLDMAESNIKDLFEISILSGIKLAGLVATENLNRRMELVYDHFLGFELNHRGEISKVSDALLQQLGASRKEIIGQTPEHIFAHKQPESLEQLSKNTEVQLRTKDGDTIWLENTNFEVDDALGINQHQLVLQQDITKLKKMEELSIKDELTHLYNRRFFNQMFPREISICRRHKKILSFMMVDIDNFKKYNDTYGHQEGDAVLKSAAKAMSHCFKRESDYVFRLGGEEFGVMAIIENEKDGEMLANLMREAIQNLQIPHTGNLPKKIVTISCGVVNIKPDDIDSTDDLYKLADVALYDAKTAGRNQVIVSGQSDDIELF